MNKKGLPLTEGCGKMAFCYNCDKFVSCPSCSNSNQSPQNSEGGNNSSEDTSLNVITQDSSSGDDTLSDKRRCNMQCLLSQELPYYPEKDVKDFIKKLKEELAFIRKDNKKRWKKYNKNSSDLFRTYLRIMVSIDSFNSRIDSLAGNKLIREAGEVRT